MDVITCHVEFPKQTLNWWQVSKLNIEQKLPDIIFKCLLFIYQYY